MDKLTRKRKLKSRQRDWNLSASCGIEIFETSGFGDEFLKFGINFGALGTITIERATEFSNKLNECIKLVKYMNSEAVE